MASFIKSALTLLLLCGTAITSRAATHTVYFCSPRAGWDTFRAYVWHDNKTTLTTWDNREALTYTGKKCLVDDLWLPLYSYTFEWDNEPLQIIFTSSKKISDDAKKPNQTADLAFHSGGYYTEAGLMETAPTEFIEYSASHTVYFADTDNWGPERTLVHVWDAAGNSLTPWTANEPMAPTGRYTLVNGTQWAPVYSYTFDYAADIAGLLFHKKGSDRHLTCDLRFADGTMYAYNSEKAYYPPVDNLDLEALPQKPGSVTGPLTFIVNLGANQLAENLWHEPCCHLWRRDASDSYDAAIPARGSEQYGREVMTMLSEGIYTITVDDPGDANDIIFYYYSADGTPQPFPASRSPYFNPTAWSTYVFDIGIDCVHQSYVTPSTYTEAMAAPSSKTRIYLTGNSAVDPAFGFNDPARNIPLDRDEGIFVHKFTVADEAIQFKLSRFDPKVFADEAFAVTLGKGENVPADGDTPAIPYTTQRGWATFNLGIVGCRTEQSQQWIDRHIYAPGNGQSRQVRILLDNTMPYNTSTQYPWRIDGDNISVGSNCWLVVDAHDGDRSVTLLDFDPNPGIDVESAEITSLPLTYDQAAQLHDPMLPDGAAANGPVLFDRVNIVQGKAAVTAAAGNDLVGRTHSVVYTVYLEHQPVASYDGVPSEVAIPYMTPGNDADVAVRARYTDLETGASFCSHFANGTVSSTFPDLPVPSGTASDNQLVNYRDGDEGFYLGGATTIYYNLDNPAGLVYFPDYTLRETTLDETPVTATASLIHSAHPLAALNLYHQSIPYTPAEDTDGYTADNNWANAVAAAGKLPVVIDDVALYDPEAAVPTIGARFDIHALYPFMTLRPAADEAPAGNDPKRRAPGIPDNLAAYTVTLKRTTAPVETAIHTDVMTGIDNPTVPAETAPRYYDLGGSSVDIGKAAPGVYIELRGTAARKIIVK